MRPKRRKRFKWSKQLELGLVQISLQMQKDVRDNKFAGMPKPYDELRRRFLEEVCMDAPSSGSIKQSLCRLLSLSVGEMMLQSEGSVGAGLYRFSEKGEQACRDFIKAREAELGIASSPGEEFGEDVQKSEGDDLIEGLYEYEILKPIFEMNAKKVIPDIDITDL